MKEQDAKNLVLDKLLIGDVICCGDLVYIEHLDSFFEVLEINKSKFIGTKLGEDTLETYELDIDDINTLWLKSHCI